MKIYMTSFLYEGRPSGDALAYRLKRNAEAAFLRVFNHAKKDFPELDYKTDMGGGILKQFDYIGKDGHEKGYRLWCQVTED